MTRIHVVVEGPTEETFVNNTVAPYFGTLGIFMDARSVETSRKRIGTRQVKFTGGVSEYSKIKRDITLWTKEDHRPTVFFTTMVDLYSLPTDFPGYDDAKPLSAYERVMRLEKCWGEDINHPRFIPYIQLHEFEALLFANPSQFDWEFIAHERAIRNLEAILQTFGNPELINDGEATAPSKRIIHEIPQYKHRKPSAGPLIAEKIGLATLRRKCSHFDAWVSKLESLEERAR